MSDTKSRATASTQGRISRMMEKVKHDKYNSKCVCEICVCGMIDGTHRCPPVQRRRFQGRTTNQDDYKPYRVEPNQDAGPVYKVQQRHYDPEAMYTTYNLQYTPKRVPIDSVDISHSVENIRVKTPFYGQTEYNSKLMKKPILYDQSEQIYQYRPNRAKFEGTTSYNAEFTPKKAEYQIQNPQNFYSRKKIPFYGESSYNSQFKRYKVVPEQNQQYVYKPNTAKFLGQSRYKQDFHSYPLKTYENSQESCPTNELPKYPPACPPGRRHLYYSAEKNNWE